jgi:phenylalanyl-tRNA synthetase alpha chain
MSDTLSRALALRDLTDPAAGEHAMQHIVATLETALSSAWGVPVRRDPGPRVVSVGDNYDRLRYSAEAVTRDRRYSRYLGDGTMLRSHTTARIPALLRTVPDDDVLLSVPGICYRRDAIDRQHVGEPHQLDLWRVHRRGRPLAGDDLQEMVQLVVEAVLPDRRWWTVPSLHPYTLDGREIYVDGVEVGECGLSHPALTAGGLAMGLGLDRLVMLVKGIDDIRLLRSTDPRVAAQMRDLTPYRPVSTMPPVRRDLSLAVDGEADVEVLGDRVRGLLDADASAVEEVAVLAETAYADLPPAARDRMGVRPGQKNVLLRVILRDLERTLTAADANVLRDRIYAGLHEGARSQWASR